MTDWLGYRPVARRCLLACLALAAAMIGVSGRASAQAPGFAEIGSPAEGQSVSGVVTITGTADHPAFLRFDLAFSYRENPTDTWFRLGDPVTTRVRQGTLGLWDTTLLAPGAYRIRLRVHLDNGAVLTDEVTDLRVGLPPPPTPTASAAGISPATALPPTQAAPSPVPTTSAAPVRRTDPVGLAAAIGGGTAAAVLLFLAIFLPLRRRMALWAGSMRMRRLLRQDEQRRRGRNRR